MQELLVKNGRLVDAPDAKRRTPLHLAVLANQKRAVKALLSHGANVNARDAEKTTALHFACRIGSAEIAALLIRKGADCDAQDAQNRTPQQACEYLASSRLVSFACFSEIKTNPVTLRQVAPASLDFRDIYEKNRHSQSLHDRVVSLEAQVQDLQLTVAQLRARHTPLHLDLVVWLAYLHLM